MYVIIDDEELVVKFLKSVISIIKRESVTRIFDCHTPEGLEEMISIIVSHEPESVTFFIDNHMPALDYQTCIEVARELREVIDIKVIIVGMSGDPSKEEEMIASGADLFIEKVCVMNYLKKE